MKLEPGRCSKLEKDLLRLYKHAVVNEQLDVAEHILGALEAIAQSKPDSQQSLEQAYLFLAASDYTRSQ